MVTKKVREKVIGSMLRLAEDGDWSDVTLEAIASNCSMDLVQLRAAYNNRLEIIADFARQTDEKVLANLDDDLAEEDHRERLFDVLYSRFEVLEANKGAILTLTRQASRDAPFAMALNRITAQSMVWMLNAAGIETTGRTGRLRVLGATAVWYRTMRVWLKDEDPGHARTMATLDQRLREGERMLGRLNRVRHLPRLICRRPRSRPDPDVFAGGKEALDHGA